MISASFKRKFFTYGTCCKLAHYMPEKVKINKALTRDSVHTNLDLPHH